MLAVSPAVYDEMVEHARGGAPEEVCGVLGGERGERRSRATVARRADNVAPTPETAYAIDPGEQLALMEAVESAGRDVVGFYHSHPRGPPKPSATDRAQATWPGYSYVVVDLAGEEPDVGAWRWTGETFERETLERR